MTARPPDLKAADAPDVDGAARALLAELDVDRVVALVPELARGVTGARFAALGVADDSGRRLARWITSGIDAAARRLLDHEPVGEGVLGVVLADPRPLRLDDLGSHPHSYGFPIGHPPMTTFLGVPVWADGRLFGALYLTERAGAPAFTADDEEAAVTLASWAGVAIANAARHTTLVRRARDLERNVRAFDTTTEVARVLAGETDLDRVLELIVKRSRALLNARLAVIALLEGDEVVVRGAAGEDARRIAGRRAPIEDTLTARILASRRAARLPRVPKWALDVNAEAVMVAPMYFRGRPLGVLAVVDCLRENVCFDDEDERLMDAFTATAAPTVATARDIADQLLRRSLDSSERERRRWARELHDETLQELAALKLMLAAARRADPDGGPAVVALTEGVERVQQLIGGLRSLITDLRPAALDELGLAPALQALAERVRGRWGLEVKLDLNLDYAAGRAPTRLDPELESTVYRLVQEALSNAAKHAEADCAEVRIVEHPDLLEIRVIDDGRGFAIEQATAGFGVAGMRERVALVGGELHMRSKPGKGTEVHASLPAHHLASQGPDGAAGHRARG